MQDDWTLFIVILVYKCTSTYFDKQHENGILWNIPVDFLLNSITDQFSENLGEQWFV